MGADYVIIIDCPLQSELGADAFAHRVKLGAQVTTLEEVRATIEAQTGKRLESLELVASGTNNPERRCTFADAQRLALKGIPQCAQCPISSGAPLGCYRYVTYPIDSGFEELLFDFFLATVENPAPEYVVAQDAKGTSYSASSLVYEHVLLHLDQRTPWHEQRGPADRGGLAERSEPLVATLLNGRPIDSARVLQATFHPIDGDLALQLYAHYFAGFCNYAAGLGFRSRTHDEVAALTKLLTAASQRSKTDPVATIVWA